jgi:phosphoglycolate phosphatase-like HAD superfamily hydrolase
MFHLTPQHDFLVAIDSDGCAFDTMELKHKECFIPSFVNFYNLQAISKFARETWEFVNLYSKTRGMNRFTVLVLTLDLLAKRPEVIARGVDVSVPDSLREWARTETRLNNPVLQKKLASTNDPALAQALAWSQDVNERIAAMVRHVPPFAGVRECLQRSGPKADLIVCSATPVAALEAEWNEHGLAQHVAAICGQEQGSKKEILSVASQYADHHVLMIGDAPGDYAAAKANSALFYPINPGAEESSWERLKTEGLQRFFSGDFAGEYQQQLLAEFDRYLPEHPTWQQVV